MINGRLIALGTAIALMAVVAMSSSESALAQTSACVTGGAVADAANTGLIADCEALLEVRDTLAGTGSLNWSANRPISQWNGIQGHSQFPSLSGNPTRVTALHLQKNGLNGTIPSALGNLGGLVYLNLHTNSLQGDLSELAGLTNLERVYVNNNRLTGIGDLSGASSLEILWAHRNQTMTGGSIPTDLPPSLTWLSVYDNNLTGGIPDLTHLTNLQRLYVHDNNLGGTIPATLGTMTSLTHLQLKGAGLTGPIPPGLGSLTNLEWLSVYNNDLSGEIPSELGDLSNLFRLYLHSNNLTSTVPLALGNLSNLTNLWLKDNDLNGQLPEELNNLTNLDRVRIRGNEFTGCIPAGLAAVEDSDIDQLGLTTCGVEPGPDLEVGPPSVDDANPETGATFTLSTTVTNAGDEESEETTLRYYQSTDDAITTEDTEVGSVSVVSLAAVGVGNFSIGLTVPSTPGTYYYGACVDAVTDESDTTDNCSASVQVTVSPSTSPDLEVETPSVNNASPRTGASFTLSATVTNAGDEESEETTLRYYRSTDNTISTSDAEVGSDAVEVLAVDGTSDQSISLTAPSTAGTYYYGACVDAVTDESDTTNNCSASVKVDVEDSNTPTKHPNLEVGTPTVSDSSPATGETFTLSATVSNTGDGASDATTLRYYRSTDATITTLDSQVGTDAVGALAASGAGPESISLTAPSTAGTYYYGACVDAVTDESDTTDNCSSSARVQVFQGSPNLELSTPTVDNDLPAMGTTFTLSVTVTNAGDGAAASTTLRYYRSTDETITTADTELDTDAVAGLGASGSSAESATLDVPTTPAPGSYYFYGACVDSVTGESDTTDNCSTSVMVRVAKPDLWIKYGGGYLRVGLGGTFTKWTYVENAGGGASAPTTIRFLLSEDDKTVTASDTTVATVNLSSVLPGSSSGRVDGRIPAPSNPGWYYYGVCVDPVPGETNTGNNCWQYGNVKVGEFECQPDLVMDTPSVNDNSPSTYGRFTLSATVKNGGCAYSVETTVRYYRSLDSTITTSDSPEGTDDIGQLNGTGLVYDPEGSSQSIDLNAPATPGTYYYGACVDSVTRESNTTNNCSTSVVVTVSASSGADLVVSSISVDDAGVGPGTAFTLSGTVTNVGGVGAAATTLRYYRSTDASISTSDTEVGSDSVGELAAAGTSDQSISLTAPSDTGTYYYGACVDAVTDEAVTNNNCSSAVKVTVDRRPDLAMSATVSPTEVSPGARFSVNGTLTNEGEVDVAARLIVRFYRSEDSTITTSDTNLSGAGIYYGDELAAGSSKTGAESFLRAPSTPGTYYYGACVNTVANEWSTTNNCSNAAELTVAVYPDLSLSTIAMTWQVPLVPGGTFSLSARIENEGNGESSATTVRFYHSEDDTISPSTDTEVGTVALEALAAGAIVHKRVVDLTVPATAGSYYYGACVDSVADETDTTNNCTQASTLVVPEPAPNLTLFDIEVSDRTRDPGESFTLSATVFNSGALEAAATTLRYYRTTVSPWILDPSTDTAVGTDSVGALAAAAESEESIELTAPAIPDNYYYYACVDSVTDETETRDNCPYQAVRVTVTAPNLQVGTPTVDDASPDTGATFTLSATVTNAGTEGATATTLRYYRSTDATITTSDTEVGTDDVGALAAAGTSAQSIDLTAPSTAGTYYYGACVDSVTDESPTTDNCSSSVTVTATAPDLEVGTPSVDNATLGTGAAFTLSATVTNAGDRRSAATTLRYYRSPDATITSADTAVGTDAVGELAAAGTSGQSIDLTAPSTAGTYYYGACVDSVTDESDTTDNCSVSVQVVVE